MSRNNTIDTFFDNTLKGPFCDMPFETDINEYDKVTDYLVDKWSSSDKPPVAVYRLGEIKAPGISDLDFILVFDDDSEIEMGLYNPGNHPDWVRKLMTHAPYFSNIWTWASLPAWYPFFDACHVWGDELTVPRMDERFNKGCCLGMLIDYLLVKMPRDIFLISGAEPIRMRILLSMLNSFKHTVNLAGSAGINVPVTCVETIKEVDTLRNDWHRLSESEMAERTEYVLKSVCSGIGRVISETDKVLSEEIHDVKKGLKADIRKNRKDLFSFCYPWVFDDTIRRSISKFYENGFVLWENPLSFIFVLAVYAKAWGGLGKYIFSTKWYKRIGWDGGAWAEGLMYHARGMMGYSLSAMKMGVPPQRYIALGYKPEDRFLEKCKYYFKKHGIFSGFQAGN